MIATDAWVLHAGPEPGRAESPPRAVLSRERYAFGDVGDDEVLTEPLYGCWEGNLEHALARRPIDICRARGEDPVILGNSGIVRVLASGAAARGHHEGDICMVLPFGKRDPHGYAETVHAYDEPATDGILAMRIKFKAGALLPIPADTVHALARWGATGRHFVAWDNWRLAHAVWTLQMREADPADALVFGWGGGVAFAELLLARRAGFRVAMTAGTDSRLSLLKEHGIEPVDRRLLADLSYDETLMRDNPDRRNRYRAAERHFLSVIGELSGGRGVAIFVDNIGAPLHRSAVKALSRQGVLSTVGWKHGMRTLNMRASDCINRRQFVNTHVWRYGDSPVIRDYIEETGWIADADQSGIYEFDDVPRLAEDYAAERISSYFPLFRINPELS